MKMKRVKKEMIQSNGIRLLLSSSLFVFFLLLLPLSLSLSSAAPLLLFFRGIPISMAAPLRPASRTLSLQQQQRSAVAAKANVSSSSSSPSPSSPLHCRRRVASGFALSR